MELYNDDCFNVFPKIKDKSINLFLLDLPYGQTPCKWDSVIDLDKMWIEIKRMMKSNGIIVFFCTAKFGNTIINSNPKWFKYDLIWKKSRKVGFLSANKMPLRQHENIYVFKEEQGTYNPQKTEGKPYKTIGTGECEVYRANKRLDGNNTGDRHPTSIIENTILEYNTPAKSLHRTQKPVELCEWLIKTYTNEDDVVMDFTMGSGTTGIACSNTNRDFIGVEMDKEIFEIAEKRILDHLLE
jgi:site-specific DNA-methyltransferase (adenine-specific)